MGSNRGIREVNAFSLSPSIGALKLGLRGMVKLNGTPNKASGPTLRDPRQWWDLGHLNCSRGRINGVH